MTAIHQRRRPALALALVCLVGGLAVPAAAASATPLPGGRFSTPAIRTSSAAPTTCHTVARLRRWRTSRLAAQVLTAPVQMSAIAAAGPLVQAGFGGLLLFGASAPTDLGQQLSDLDSASLGGLDPIVMSDEEGGSVQRLLNVVGPVPSARDMGRTRTLHQIRAIGARVGTRMHAAGVSMDLAPVLDLDNRPGPSATNPDGTRSFGMDPQKVGRQGLAFARGLMANGVVATVKHFPGLGHATGNTDVGPAATLPWRVLRTKGLLPFRTAVEAGVPAVMVSNATVPGLAARPASLSPVVMQRVLRTRLGFHGAIVTDSLSAGAIRSVGLHAPKAAVASLAAGADLILFGGGGTTGTRLSLDVLDRVTHAVAHGDLARSRLVDAAAHVLALKQVDLCRP